jgi:hypothetical protein
MLKCWNGQKHPRYESNCEYLERNEKLCQQTFYITKQHLNDRVLQVWRYDQGLIQLAQRETESMPQYIQAPIKATEGPTKYYDIYFLSKYVYLLFKNNFLHIRSC